MVEENREMNDLYKVCLELVKSTRIYVFENC
jgi:hypothetical protein